MAASYNDVRRWLYLGNDGNYSHMVVYCDTWDYEDHVVYVPIEKDVKDYIREHQGNPNNMDKVMEVYSYSLDLEKQLREEKAYHLEYNPVEKRLDIKSIDDSNGNSTVIINEPNPILFADRGNIKKDFNGYINRDGDFYPTITISSTKNSEYNKRFISMDQYADAFVNQIIQDEKIKEEYTKLIKEKSTNALDDIIVNKLGYGKFYRYYTNDNCIQESSLVPSRAKSVHVPTIKQLMIIKLLFQLNPPQYVEAEKTIDEFITFQLSKVSI